MKNAIPILLIFFLFSACKPENGGEIIFVESDPENGFHFPYFLFIPENASPLEATIIIEPNNSGFAADDFQKHIEKAKRIASSDFYLGNFVARDLGYSLLVPVFPRPETDWRVYTHALDRDVMTQKGNNLERIDLQLIRMFEDARKTLKEKNMETRDQFLLTGFSASGTFANRFSIIHPDKVLAVAAGGVNGLLLLPADSLGNLALDYPLGVNDLEGLTGRPFQRELFSQTAQFYFMGELDDNDAVPFEDAFDAAERELIFNLMGVKMLPGRWEFCSKVYEANHINASIKTYNGIGHEHPENIKKEISAFFREVISGNVSPTN